MILQFLGRKVNYTYGRKMSTKHNISSETIKRMITYLRYLDIQKNKGVNIISSKDVTSFLNVPPEQFRKDLSFFGGFGKRGVGYNVDKLLEVIKGIIGLNEKINAVLVGAGKLGAALIQYPGFSAINIDIIAAFDNDVDKIGRSLRNIKIYNVKNVGRFIKGNNVEVALLCVPAESAQFVADSLVHSGIKGILNFVPISLILPDNICVGNVDMASEIGNIIYHMKSKNLSSV
jgi:redox-sensing transcriptional repressor